MNKLFRCAIIGCGNIGGKYDRTLPDTWSFTHAGAYYLCPYTKLAAAADTDSKALKDFGERWGVERLYTDYREMFEMEKLDILSLCLPTEKHYEAFRFASEMNIPAIFCEKPLSYDLEEARKMVRMSEGRIVAVNYFRRWNPALMKLREDLNRGVYGRIVNITSRYTNGIFVNGSHLVDLMRWFFGEPDGIHLIKNHNPSATDPGVDFVLTFDNDLPTYFLHVPNVQYVFVDVDILTEKARVVVIQRGQCLEKYDTVLEPHYRKFHILMKIKEKETGWRECMARALGEIADCLKNGGRSSCTPEDGLLALEICRKAMC